MSREYNYTEEFKVQISKLRESGKPISAIVKEYGISKSTISKWHHDYTNNGIILFSKAPLFCAYSNIFLGHFQKRLTIKRNVAKYFCYIPYF